MNSKLFDAYDGVVNAIAFSAIVIGLGCTLYGWNKFPVTDVSSFVLTPLAAFALAWVVFKAGKELFTNYVLNQHSWAIWNRWESLSPAEQGDFVADVFVAHNVFQFSPERNEAVRLILNRVPV